VVVLISVIIAGQLFGLGGVLVTMPILAAATVLTGFFLDRLRVRHHVRPFALASPPAAPLGASGPPAPA
jgi:predicted PurR-regulated permease PerM